MYYDIFLLFVILPKNSNMASSPPALSILYQRRWKTQLCYKYLNLLLFQLSEFTYSIPVYVSDMVAVLC